MGAVFVFLVFIAIFAGIMCFAKNYRKIKLDIPAPLALPIIGHVHLMIGLNNEGNFVTMKNISILKDTFYKTKRDESPYVKLVMLHLYVKYKY